jgi:SLT domain-containing protein
MRHPELKAYNNDDLMKLLGYTYIGTAGKHRYVIFRGSKKDKKKLLLNIKNKILPYPKFENHVS